MLHGCYMKAAHATMEDDVLGPQQAVHPRGSVGRSVRVSRISKAAAARLQGYGRDTPCSDSKPVCRSMAFPAATARLHGYGQDLESSSNAFCAPVCQSATFKAAVATLQPDVQNPSDLGLRARGPPQPAGPPFKRLRTTAGSRYDCNSAIRSTKAVTSRNQTDGQLRFDGSVVAPLELKPDSGSSAKQVAKNQSAHEEQPRVVYCKPLPLWYWRHPGAREAIAGKGADRIGVDFGGVIQKLDFEHGEDEEALQPQFNRKRCGRQSRSGLDPADRKRCEHKQCNFFVHSNPKVSMEYCCKKCAEADHNGHPPAHGFKCEKKEVTITPSLGPSPPSTAPPEHLLAELSAVPGVFSAVRSIVEHFGRENVFIVSRAGQRRSEESTRWLRQVRFFERTGCKESNVFYVRLREQKRIVAEMLGLTHFVDDRWSVLDKLEGCCIRRYLFPSSANDRYMPDALVDRSVIFGQWEHVLADLGLTAESPAHGDRRVD